MCGACWDWSCYAIVGFSIWPTMPMATGVAVSKCSSLPHSHCLLLAPGEIGDSSPTNLPVSLVHSHPVCWGHRSKRIFRGWDWLLGEGMHSFPTGGIKGGMTDWAAVYPVEAWSPFYLPDFGAPDPFTYPVGEVQLLCSFGRWMTNHSNCGELYKASICTLFSLCRGMAICKRMVKRWWGRPSPRIWLPWSSMCHRVRYWSISPCVSVFVVGSCHLWCMMNW